MANVNLKSLVAMAALSVVAVQAQAVTACATGTSTKVSINGGSGATNISTFFKQGFDVQCSNNTYVDYVENTATLLSVGAVSVKGNQQFGGNSNGGAIRAMTKCTADPCGAAESGTAAGNASSL